MGQTFEVYEPLIQLKKIFEKNLWYLIRKLVNIAEE